MKTGRLGKEEQQYIIDNVKHSNYINIARFLERRPGSIKDFIEKKLGLQTQLTSDAQPNIPARSELRDRKFWSGLEKQFSSEELEHFEEEWGNIHAQFKNDVLATEESQIIDAIKVTILMHRNLQNQRDTIKIVEELMLDLEANKDGDPSEKSYIKERIGVQRAAQSSLTREYKDLQDQKNKLLQGL